MAGILSEVLTFGPSLATCNRHCGPPQQLQYGLLWPIHPFLWGALIFSPRMSTYVSSAGVMLSHAAASDVTVNCRRPVQQVNAWRCQSQSITQVTIPSGQTSKAVKMSVNGDADTSRITS